MMLTRLLLLAAAMLATAGCHKNTAAPGNDAAANITTLDVNSLPPDANITELPADDGDAPAEAETNAR